MEKYVLPQNNNSDFKFPASHLPLQQLRRDKSQSSMSQLADAALLGSQRGRLNGEKRHAPPPATVRTDRASAVNGGKRRKTLAAEKNVRFRCCSATALKFI